MSPPQRGVGAAIRRARERRGWKQADLARLLNVSQQTLSRWEAGKSSPRRSDLQALAHALDLDPGELSPGEALPAAFPVRPLISSLPLELLSSEQFEAFCTDFVHHLHPGAHRWGGQGDAQEGLDIVAELPDGRVIGFQCKRRESFGPAKVEAAVAAAMRRADHYVLLLSRAASVRARAAIAEFPEWSLWDKNDISRRVRDLPDDRASRLLNSYFPELRAHFLGVVGGGPWLSPEEFFRPFLGRGGGLSHDWPMVGRERELDHLCRQVLSGASKAVVVVGTGGSGKSRLLKAFCDRATREEPGLPIRLLAEDAVVEQRDLEGLGHGPSIMVVDDAHRHDDLETLLLGVTRFAPQARLVLALREYGAEQVMSGLARLGLLSRESDESSVLRLEDLSADQSSALARRVLEHHAGPLEEAPVIGELTRDCPLATVVGSRLVASGRVAPRLLANQREFRSELLRAFRDELLGNLGMGPDQAMSRDLLELMAVVQPVADEQRFARMAEKLSGVESHRVLRLLGALEAAGILRRRAGRIRLVPDLLGDVLVGEACWETGRSRPTGFADRVFAAAGGPDRFNVLHNVGRLDSQLSVTSALGRTRILDDVWAAIFREFRSAGILERSELLRALSSISWYQPDQALDLARLAIDEPTAHVEDDPRAWLGLSTDYRLVLDEVPSVLRGAAHFRRRMPDSMALLWELVRDDPRPMDAHRRPATRVLRDLLTYRLEKPLSFVEEAVEIVVGWIDDDPLGKSSCDPLDLLDPVFDIEFADPRWTSDRELEWRRGHVLPPRVRRIRGLVVDAAIGALSGPSIRRAARAVTILNKAALRSRPLFGEDARAELVAVWEPEAVSVMDRLRSTIENHALDPVVLDRIVDVMGPKLSDKGPYGDAARAVLNAVGDSADLRVTQAMSHWYAPAWFARGREYAEAEPEWRNFLEDAAKELGGGASSERIAARLGQRLTALAAVEGGGTTVARAFCDHVFHREPEVARLVVREQFRLSTSPFGAVWHLAYAWLRCSDQQTAMEHATEAVDRDDPMLICGVLEALARDEPAMPPPSPAEVDILRRLCAHPVPAVRAGVADAAGRLARTELALALHIILHVPVDGSRLVAQAVCRQLDSRGPLPAAGLTDEHREALLHNLESCPALDEHGVQHVVKALFGVAPLDVIELLLWRINRPPARPLTDDYRPIPYGWTAAHSPLGTQGPSETVIESILRWTASNLDEAHQRFWAPMLWLAVVPRLDTHVLSVLKNWVESPNAAHVMAVSTVLANGPAHFVLTEVDFVSGLLQRASQHGAACLRWVRNDLWRSATSGVRGHSPGTAAPEDLRRRDGASEAAARLRPGSVSHLFYRDLSRAAEEDLRWTIQVDHELEEEAEREEGPDIDVWSGEK